MRPWQSSLLCITFVFSAGLAAYSQAANFPSSSIPQNGDLGLWRYNGVKRSLYYVVHNANSPFTQLEWENRVNSIRSTEQSTREFFAKNSGGKFDIYYDSVVVDAPISLNPDGTRPGNWRSQTDAIASNQYGLNLSDYFMYAYDLDDTNATPGQGWGGLSQGDAIYLQNPGVKLNNHEIGHRISLGHARAITPRNNTDFTTYVWDSLSETYTEYVPGISDFHATPFGSPVFQYGNPFETMGNIGSGQFSVEKKWNIGWLSDEQVPSLDGPDGLGEGVFRIYAHDELEAIEQDGVYGVVDTYDTNSYYGLSFERTGEEYNSNTNEFEYRNQRIIIEYRSGEDGLAFYLDQNTSNNQDDAVLIDLDPEGVTSYGNRERLLEVGSGVEDYTFGLSNFLIAAGSINQTLDDIDFLEFDPVPPSDPTALRPNWYHFSVLGGGADAIGSYMELAVTLVNPLNGIAGDLDQSGFVDQTDLDLFLAGWMTDTRALAAPRKYLAGDMDLNGITDLRDLGLFRDVIVALGDDPVRLTDAALRVPEPSALAIVALFSLAVVSGHRYSRCNHL